MNVNRFAFLDIFRAVAAPMVVYSHVVTMFYEPNRLRSPVTDTLDEQLLDPLRIEQHLGYLGVVMFFLVSGFIVTEVGIRQSHREYLIKRVLRVYPLLAFAVLLAAALSLAGLQVLSTGQPQEVTVTSVLTNVLLANYFMVPQVVLVGVAWTLIIEVIFYATVLVLLPLLRRATWLAIATELAMILVVLLAAREFGTSFFLLAVSVSYLPVVLLGQITWAVWSGRIPLSAGALFGAIGWTLYVWADERSMGRLDGAYNSTLVLAFLLFVVALLAEPRLRPNRVISFLADRSYSLYLMHGLLALPVMDAWYPAAPAPVAVLIGLLVTMGAVELTYRYVEIPGQRFARRLTRRYRLESPGRARHRLPGRARSEPPAFAGRAT